MKLIFLLLFFVVLSAVSIAGQRRFSSVEINQQETTNPRQLRGRARFSQTTESIEVPQEYERTRSRPNRNQQRSKIIENRNSRTSTTTTTTTIQPEYVANGYEVKESIEDTPPDFSATKLGLLPNGDITNDNNMASQDLSPQSSTTTTPTTQRIAEEISEIKKELPQVEPTSLRNDDRNLKSSRISDRRNPLRSQKAAESVTVTNRRRLRNRNPNEVPSSTTAATTSITRPTRRTLRGRITESTTRQPISPEITSTETVRRSRTGRKVVPIVSTSTEITPPRNRNNNRRSGNGGQILIKSNEIQSRSNSNQKVDEIQLRSNINQKVDEISLRSNSNQKVDDTRRLRSRPRHLPPILNENQLEVLPLFEREDENLKISNNKGSNPSQNSVETVTKTTRSRQRPNSRQIIVKQSVISEVNEVTSRRTVTRIPRRRLESSTVVNNKNNNDKRRKTVSDDKKIKENLTNSAEEVDESDNYPEAFKTLIQARKTNKETKVTTRKTTSRVVQPASTTTTTTTTTPSPTKISKKQPFPRRFPSTTRPVKEKTSTISTTTVSTTTTRKPERFHAKINNVNYQKLEISTVTPKFSRTQPTKHTRKLYSSKKRDEYEKRVPHSTQIPPSTFARSNRYSSRYRKNILSNGKRVGNTPPVYQPTVPTIRTTPAAKSLVEDKDLGLEVVTINDPIYTPPSANLVNANYTNPESDNKILVAEAQTKPSEKPKSLIEQIISSITAITTTPSPPTATPLSLDNNVILTTETVAVETTRPTTILRLTTKKTDKIDDRRTTTERPTTVIEKILNSLSAIQLEATTENNDILSTTTTTSTTEEQVGTDLNTISPSIFPTPIGENLINNAPSTIVNNLDVLDSVFAEEILQKDTIDSLLEILRSLSSTPTPTTTIETTTAPTTTITTSTAQEMLTTETLASTIRLQLESRFGSDASELTTPISTTLSNEIVPETTTTTTTTTETNTQTLTTTDPPTTIVPENFNNNPTIVPPLIRFEVSPGSVSVFSVNDLANSITSDDIQISTVTIPNRSNSQLGSTSTSVFAGTTSLPETTTVITSDDNQISTVTIPNQSNSQLSSTSTSVFSSTTALPETTTVIPFQSDSSDTLTTESSTSTTISTVETQSSVTTEDIPTSEISSIMETSTINTEAAPFTSAPSTPIISSTLEPSISTTIPPTSTLNASDLDNVITTTLIPTTENNSIQSLVNPLSNEISTTSNASVNSQSNQGGFLNNNNSSQIGLKNRATLQPITEPINNSIDISTPSTVAPNKDYFIFAILNNNTILRKRPSEFPNEMTPYLVVGVYPNNTIVRKFPNGTLVPMEPVIRVSGFDTRANPPTLTEITSNQVTPDQGSEQDNTNLQMNQPTTISPIEANALTVNESFTDSTTATTTTATTTTTTSSTTTTSTTPTTTTITTTTSTTSNNASEVTTQPNNENDSIAILPTLNEILNGNTVKAFTSIINISDLSGRSGNSENRTTTTPMSLTMPASTTEEALPMSQIFTSAITTPLPLSTSVDSIVTVTPEITTTTPGTTTSAPITTTNQAPTTTITTTQVPTTSLPSTTNDPTTTTTVPSLPSTTTVATTTTTEPITTSIPTTTTTPATVTTTFATTTTTTNPPTTTPEATTATTVPATVPTTIVSARANALAIQDNEVSSTRSNSVAVQADAQVFTSPALSSTKSPKQLTKQQLEDLQTLARLESEQAAILKQLAFLNNLNLVNQPVTTQSSTDLANKIIALAVERSNQKDKTTTTSSVDSQKVSADTGRANLEQLLSNIPKTTNIQSSFGKSNDAIIAELLKNQGIAPTTPNGLAAIYTKTTITPTIPTTTKRAPTTTKKPAQPRAPALMQGLRWLLNAFNGAPTTTTQRPKPKTKAKPKNADKETLVNQPTRITPVVVSSPQPLPLSNSVPQSDVEFLIKKLEAIQRDPKNTKLDLETQEKLQNFITGGGFDGNSLSTTTPTTTTKARREKQISTTISPTTTERIVIDDFISVSPTTTTRTTSTTKPKTTTRTRISLPPVQLSSVPGVGDDETLVRGQLISAAINVTRALTQFLGSALQGAAYNFQNLLGSGSRYIGTFARGSSTNSSSSLS